MHAALPACGAMVPAPHATHTGGAPGSAEAGYDPAGHAAQPRAAAAAPPLALVPAPPMPWPGGQLSAIGAPPAEAQHTLVGRFFGADGGSVAWDSSRSRQPPSPQSAASDAHGFGAAGSSVVVRHSWPLAADQPPRGGVARSSPVARTKAPAAAAPSSVHLTSAARLAVLASRKHSGSVGRWSGFDEL